MIGPSGGKIVSVTPAYFDANVRMGDAVTVEHEGRHLGMLVARYDQVRNGKIVRLIQMKVHPTPSAHGFVGEFQFDEVIGWKDVAVVQSEQHVVKQAYGPAHLIKDDEVFTDDLWKHLGYDTSVQPFRRPGTETNCVYKNYIRDGSGNYRGYIIEKPMHFPVNAVGDFRELIGITAENFVPLPSIREDADRKAKEAKRWEQMVDYVYHLSLQVRQIESIGLRMLKVGNEVEARHCGHTYVGHLVHIEKVDPTDLNTWNFSISCKVGRKIVRFRHLIRKIRR